MEKKKVLTAVAVGAATMAAGVGANQAKADSVKVTKQVIGDETKITTTTTKTVDSQEQIDQTKQKVSDQKKVTAQASSTVDKDSQQVSQDKSNVAHWESVKKDATPANISANKQAQASQQSKISADKSTISGQQKNVDSAQSSVNSAQSNLNDKKAAQASAQTAYNNAENDYNKAKGEVANSQQAIANQQNQVNQDKKTLASDQSKVTDLTNQVSSDQNKVTADENDINNVGQKAQADQDKLNKDESSLSAAQKQLNSDQQKLNDLQNQANSTFDPQQIINELPPVGQAWIDDVWKNPNATFNNLSNAADQASGDLANWEQNLEDSNTPLGKWYGNTGLFTNINNPAWNYKVDPTNLTESEKILMNQVALLVLNHYRAMAGLAPLKTNSTVIGEASLANQIETNNITGGNIAEADNKKLQSAVQGKYGLNVPVGEISSKLPYKGQNANYDPDFGPAIHDGITMNELLDDVASDIVYILTDDTNTYLGHTHMLMTETPDGYIAFGYNTDEWDGKADGYNLQWVPNSADTIKQDGKENLFSSQNDITELSGQKVSGLQNQIASAKQAVQNDQNQVDSLANQVNADKAQLAQDTPSGMQQQLANDKAKLAQDAQALNNAKQALANDQQTLQNDENTLSQMQQNANDPQAYLNKMANQVATAKTNLDNANNVVAQAQQAYDTAEANLQKQQQILSNDEAQLAKDEATLKNLQQQAQDYQNAGQSLANAQKQLAADLAKYNQDHQTYLDDLQVLNELETELLNEEKTYTATSVQWIKNSHPTTTSEIGNQYVLNSRSGNSTVKFGSMDEVQAAEVPGLRRSNRNNGLPDTGDNQNEAATVVGLLGLGLAGILSMFGMAERKEN